MKLQNYLRDQGLTNLVNEFKIKVNRHQDFPNLVCLKYSQLESPLEKKIVQQCRGIILDESQDWQIVSYPYDKFFNYGESQAPAIDWDSAV
ncbi:MAG: RNA ligase, partial [Xenococcus sp. (in: cyanobacteria)]